MPRVMRPPGERRGWLGGGQGHLARSCPGPAVSDRGWLPAAHAAEETAVGCCADLREVIPGEPDRLGLSGHDAAVVPGRCLRCLGSRGPAESSEAVRMGDGGGQGAGGPRRIGSCRLRDEDQALGRDRSVDGDIADRAGLQVDAAQGVGRVAGARAGGRGAVGVARGHRGVRGPRGERARDGVNRVGTGVRRVQRTAGRGRPRGVVEPSWRSSGPAGSGHWPRRRSVPCRPGSSA